MKMEHDVFYTLHDFFLHVESMTYIILALALASILGFWFFLNGRNED